MMKALFTSATGMNAQQLMVDNTANNLANVNTTGFKGSTVDFQDLLYQTSRVPGAEVAQGLTLPTGLQVGSGVQTAATTKSFLAGALANTGNSLDMAIQGDGFFKVALPNGDFRYTRDGSFHINANGELVTADGYLVQPRLTIPTNALSVSIGTDGTISVTTSQQPNQANQVGTLTLTRFPNPAGLSSEGGNLYAETIASGASQDGQPGQSGAGTIRQGYLEQSNVDVVKELVNLIQAQRAYEFNSRAVRVADEMLSTTNDLVR